MNDPIVDEVRRLRDEHAARFDYDLDAIFKDIKAQEKKSGRVFTTFQPGRLEPNPKPRPGGFHKGTGISRGTKPHAEETRVKGRTA